MSGTGFLFTAADEFEGDELTEMEITVNPLFVIRCAARIVRRERMGDGWVYGAVFHSLNPGDMSVLSDTLAHIAACETDTELSIRPRPPLGS